MTHTNLSRGDKTLFAIIIAMLLIAWMLMQTVPVTAQDLPTTAVGIKTLLANPWVLFGFMIFGTILSMLKQWKQSQMDGATVTMGTYLSHLQELFIAVGGNVIAFFLLIDSGNLNYVSAVGIGYVLNSVADLNPAGTRSTALAKPPMTLTDK